MPSAFVAELLNEHDYLLALMPRLKSQNSHHFLALVEKIVMISVCKNGMYGSTNLRVQLKLSLDTSYCTVQHGARPTKDLQDDCLVTFHSLRRSSLLLNLAQAQRDGR